MPESSASRLSSSTPVLTRSRRSGNHHCRYKSSEFGRSTDSGETDIILADEVLTPDSSRFWSMDTYEPGRVQPSLDKQFVRNWLLSPESGWDRASGEQPPELPEEVVAKTRSLHSGVRDVDRTPLAVTATTRSATWRFSHAQSGRQPV